MLLVDGGLTAICRIDVARSLAPNASSRSTSAALRTEEDHRHPAVSDADLAHPDEHQLDRSLTDLTHDDLLITPTSPVQTADFDRLLEAAAAGEKARGLALETSWLVFQSTRHLQ